MLWNTKTTLSCKMLNKKRDKECVCVCCDCGVSSVFQYKKHTNNLMPYSFKKCLVHSHLQFQVQLTVLQAFFRHPLSLHTVLHQHSCHHHLCHHTRHHVVRLNCTVLQANNKPSMLFNQEHQPHHTYHQTHTCHLVTEKNHSSPRFNLERLENKT